MIINLILILVMTSLFVTACATPPATTASSAGTTPGATTAKNSPTNESSATTAALATSSGSGSVTLSGPMTANDLAVEINGTLFSMLAPAGPLLDGLGEPVSFAESASCLYEGTDKSYEYADFFVYTITNKGVDLIDGIDLISAVPATRRAIRLGSNRDDVLAAYGEPFSADGDLVYIIDPGMGATSPRITFSFEGDRVSYISIYSASNSINIKG